MLAPGTPVLVTWPGRPLLRGEVVDSAPDGSMYRVVTACGRSVMAIEAALVDLHTFVAVPPAAFAEPGRAQ